MLTANLVRARRRSGTLVVTPLAGKTRARALELAEQYLGITKAHEGRSRDELKRAWSAVPLSTRDKKLADGLLKLLEDACELEAESPVEPRVLRSDVFTRASEARRNGEGAVEREAILDAVAAAHGLDRDGIERALYADLKGEHLLTRVPAITAEQLVARYDHAQIQAVLLRAVRLTADVVCAAPAAYRDLFRALKFRRLLYSIEPRDTGYRITIDGPYSLFDSVTKYGLNLALALPALEACDHMKLVADVRWGKTRDKLTFVHETKRRASGEGSTRSLLESLPDEVRSLAVDFSKLDSEWSVDVAADLLDLPGIGLCVPDLVFQHRFDKRRVYFEALGFWSRDAVWRRIDLAQAGLPAPILFAVSSRLRVSEQVLDAGDQAALYVYKGVMSARAVERKLEALAAGAPA